MTMISNDQAKSWHVLTSKHVLYHLKSSQIVASYLAELWAPMTSAVQICADLQSTTVYANLSNLYATMLLYATAIRNPKLKPSQTIHNNSSSKPVSCSDKAYILWLQQPLRRNSSPVSSDVRELTVDHTAWWSLAEIASVTFDVCKSLFNP